MGSNVSNRNLTEQSKIQWKKDLKSKRKHNEDNFTPSRYKKPRRKLSCKQKKNIFQYEEIKSKTVTKEMFEHVECHCNLEYATLSEKERHIKLDHQGWFACPKCTMCFKNKVLQEKHTSTHSLSFICDICGYVGSTKSNLSEHVKGIHETNLVKCPECEKIFKNDQKLMHHKRKVHMARQCPICGEMFKTLRVHLNTVHKNDSEKKYQCQDCGKGFYDRSKLESHRMSIHIKSRPHRCRYGCDIGYNDVSNRNSHEKKRNMEDYLCSLSKLICCSLLN